MKFSKLISKILFCIFLTCLTTSCSEEEKTTSGIVQKVEKETIVITTHVKKETAKFDVSNASFPFGPVMSGDEVVIVFRGNPLKKAKASTVNLRTSGKSIKSGVDTTKELITR